MKALKNNWNDMCAALGAARNIDSTYNIVCIKYAEPHRFYHTFAHIENMLRELEKVKHLCKNYAAMQAATWLHDSIYDTESKFNEIRSAQLATILLGEMRVGSKICHIVSSAIRYTQHVSEPQSKDAKMLIDCDLSILAAAPEIFDAYEENCRKEYPQYSDKEFRFGRCAVLNRFLDRPHIFLTEHFHEKYELAARKNITRSLQKLNPQ